MAEMIEFHRLNGYYRPEDRYRMYGNPNQGVKMPMSIAELLAEIRRLRENRTQLPDAWK